MEPIDIKISDITVRIIFWASSNIGDYLRPYINDIRAGNFDKVPAKYRGIFNPITLERMPNGLLCKDGNHRVAIFKHLGLPTIKAFLVDGKRNV